MKFSDCKKLILEDLGRLADTRRKMILSALFNDTAKVAVLFRLGTYLQDAPIYLLLAKAINSLLLRHYRYKTGIQLVPGTQIKGGVKFVHFGSIVINRGVVIGRNSTIYHDVTIGAALYNNAPVARIGKNVVICAGAKIIGDVTIGDNVIIAANAVVTHDVPSGCIVGGIPAKILSTTAEDKARLWLKIRCNDNVIKQ